MPIKTIISTLEYLPTQKNDSEKKSDHEKCLKAPDDNRDQYLINPEQCTIKKIWLPSKL